MPLYCAHFLILQHDFWKSTSPPYEVNREAQQVQVVAQLFEATSPKEAYEKASRMVGGFDDAHCDGPGDLTKYTGLGLYELDEVLLAGHSLSEAINEPYGLEAGSFAWPIGQPVVKLRSELSLFREAADGKNTANGQPSNA